MSRPNWMPSGNEVARQVIIALAVGAALWFAARQLRPVDRAP
jgi:hypothetical protein